HSHAGVESGDQVLLGISEAVRAAQLAGLVDIEREPARYTRVTDPEPCDLGATPGLALPSRGDTPTGLGFRGIPPDGANQSEQVVEIDAIYDGGFSGLCLSTHVHLHCLGGLDRPRRVQCRVASAAWMRLPWSSVIRLVSTL